MKVFWLAATLLWEHYASGLRVLLMLRQLKSVTVLSGVLLCSAARAQTNSLDRPSDPVILTGQDLSSLTGLALNVVVAFRYVGGWQQVPVQIDERKWVDFGLVYNSNAVGIVTLAYADATTYCGADPDPSFDADDELVVMARDAGNRAVPATCLPTSVLTNSPVELTVTDPLNSGTGYVYLFHSDGSRQPDAGTNYVSYTFLLLAGSYIPNYGTRNGPNPEDSAAVTAYYREHFSDRWIRNQTRIFAPGADGIDILDRHRNQFSPAQCNVRNEDTFSNGEGAFFANKSGPVRAIRSYLGANSGVLTQRDHQFYERRHDITTFLRVHSIPGVMDLYDYATNATGMAYFNNLNTNGVPINGSPDVVAPGPIQWEMVTGPHGTLMFSHAVQTDINPFAHTSYYSESLIPLASSCTGDGLDFGTSGLFINQQIPSTDPGLGATNHLTVTRTVYYDAPGQTVVTAAIRHQQATTPVSVTTLEFLGDTDCDDLPDGWERNVFGDLSHPGSADDDGDDASNLAEYVAGTNPNSTASHFRLDFSQSAILFTAVKAEGAGYEGSSRHYRLESCPDLVAGDWSAVPGYEDIIGTNQVVTHTISTVPPQQFYRASVRLQQP